ncbi:MAG: Polyprenol monophosphomannose synthase [Chloroflexota bacterium]|nr:Polyprenol monophosphomannose synthase [Chloroflexota bacterium]
MQGLLNLMNKTLSLTVILPTYNERDNVPLLIAGILRAVRPPVRVLVVDDNSPDSTWQVVAEIAARDPRVRLLHRTTERGLTSAIWAGIQAADTDAVSWMDCDLAMPPEVIPALLARLAAGADLAVGSRYTPGGKDVGHSLLARTFSVTINLFASLLLGWRVRDYTSGFIAARRAIFAVTPGSDQGKLTLTGDYGEYCIDLLARAQRLGLRVEEVPYVCGARLSGESKTATNVLGYLRRGWKYVATILRLAPPIRITRSGRSLTVPGSVGDRP